MTNDLTYTPPTIGGLHEQLEFDFGPEFPKEVAETRRETNTQETLPKTACCEQVSSKTGRVCNDK